MVKTTQKQFEEFKKHCEYWIEKLKMGHYTWFFEYENLEGVNADSLVKLVDCKVYIRFGKKIDKERLDNLSELALHEVLHGLLGNMNYYANSAVTNALVLEEEHKVINHIIKALTIPNN